MEREEQERKARSQRAAEARREELAKQKGEDPVKAALERLKAKQAGSAANKETKTIVSEKGEILPDNHVKKRKDPTSKPIAVMISHAGTPNGIRTSMTTGEVKGMRELQNTKCNNVTN